MAITAFTGFETGDASELPALATGWTIQGTTKRTGAYALKEDLSALAGFQEQFFEVGLSLTELWLRVALRATKVGTGHADSNAQVNLVIGSAGANTCQLDIVTVSGTVILQASYRDNSAVNHPIGDQTWTESQFIVLELHVKAGAGTGVFEVWRDAEQLFSQTGLDVDTSTITHISSIGKREDATKYFEAYWDDYARGDARIGIGRSIARQGTAGSPNADTWTKTASQTAAQVWSETPYSATNEAHSTDQSQAQTMLVSDVGAGTNPIPAAARINACKVAVIAKEIRAASGTPTYSIRRRIDGSNTDTTKALTSSDVYYEAPIFTALRASLQAAEIGGVRGSGVDTVSFVSAGTEGSAASGNVTPGLPGSLAANDILICVAHSTDQVAHTMDAAWTQIQQGNGGGTTSRLSTWWHRYDGSTDPSRVVTHTAGDTIIAGIAAYRGCLRTGSPINTSSAVASGTDATMEGSTITPTVDGCMLLHAHGAGNDNNVTQLSGWTARLEDSAGGTQNSFQTTLGTDGMVGVQDQLQSSKAATGTITVTQGASNAWACCLVALAPAAKQMQIEDCWLMVDYAEVPLGISLNVNQSRNRAANF